MKYKDLFSCEYFIKLDRSSKYEVISFNLTKNKGETMLVHPFKSAKTQLTDVDDDMVQMHALDIRIYKLYKLEGDFKLTETEKVHRKLVAVEPNEEGMFLLEPHTMYTFDSLHDVEMAEGEAGWIIGRSTLNRNGIRVGSALYDAGYRGGVNGTIFNGSDYWTEIQRGTRIGQFIVAKAETVKLYEGEYNEF